MGHIISTYTVERQRMNVISTRHTKIQALGAEDRNKKKNIRVG